MADTNPTATRADVAVLEQDRDAVAPALNAGNGAPDPRALAVAAALQRYLPDAQVLLFGSRATGSWQPRSDIDLAVIGVEESTAPALRNQAKPHSKVVYGDAAPYVQVFTFTMAEFVRCRTALPHIAGQVQRYGLTPAGEHLPPMPQDKPWPEVQRLLHSCVRNLSKALYALVQPGLLDADVFFAQGALENVIKARLTALAVEFDRHHEMEELVDRLPRDQRWLVDIFTSDQFGQMTAARKTGMYAGDTSAWQGLSDNAHDVVLTVQQACGRMESEILELMGKTVRDVRYDAELWIDDGPLAGWGTVPVDHVRMVNRLRTNCDGLVPVATLDRIERNWLRHGPPADATVRIAVLEARAATDTDAWRELLVSPPREAPPWVAE